MLSYLKRHHINQAKHKNLVETSHASNISSIHIIYNHRGKVTELLLRNHFNHRGSICASARIYLPLKTLGDSRSAREIFYFLNLFFNRSVD